MESRADIAATAQEFLRQHVGEAFLMPELVVRLSLSGATEDEVRAAVAELCDRGVVCAHDYVWPDPHLPADGFTLVSAVDPTLPAQQGQDEALAHIDATWNRWLRTFLATHRCS